MTIALALWSRELAPGEPVEFVPDVDIKLSNAALGVEVNDQSSRSSVRLVYRAPAYEDDANEESNEEDVVPEATILCSLTPGRIEQAALNLVLEAGQAVAFENLGKNVIHLSGNYIDQSPSDLPPSDEELGLLDDEEAFNLEDVGSDIEVDADELVAEDDDDMEMEEPPSPPKKESKKRAREPEAEEVDSATPSKAEKKKLKKLKAADGEAVSVAVEADVKAKKAEEIIESKDQKKDKKKKEKKEKSEDSTPLKTQELAGGVKALDKTIGTGPEAKKGDTVSMRYVGKLEDGNVFDSNMKGKPFKFTIGDGDVIKGWDVGIVGMKAGAERQLIIPAPMGYGKRKQKDIPASSTLIFDVKLVKIIS